VKVPFLDLASLHEPLRADLEKALTDVVGRNEFILGSAVKRFEDAFASYVGRRHCVAVSSGTAALHLALLAVGVKPGDEVITTPLSFVSTSWAISYCGAKPVFADIDPESGCLDPAEVETRITSRTRALLPVDLYGNPCRLDLFSQMAKSYGLGLVDDACQAHGSRLLQRPVGSYGDVACFSFYPGKNLGAFGEGGAIVTDDPSTAEHLRQLRDHAQVGRHHHVEIGFNYRMEGLQGAVLGVKLEHLDNWNAARCRAADRYLSKLSHLANLRLPTLTAHGQSNWHLFVIRVAHRDRVKERLQQLGIEAHVHYPVPIHLQPAYSHLGYEVGAFPRAEEFALTCLSLPISPVITPEQQDEVVRALVLSLENSPAIEESV
jgi:dTDP-4-amino-4,6-dideoxygalactose transaminase